MPTHETFSQTLFKTRAILWDIISRKPSSIQQIWEFWTTIRLTEEEKIFQLHQKSAKIQHSNHSPTKTGPLIKSDSYILNHSAVKFFPTASSKAKNEFGKLEGDEDDSSSEEGFNESDLGALSSKNSSPEKKTVQTKNSELIDNITQALDSSSDGEAEEQILQLGNNKLDEKKSQLEQLSERNTSSESHKPSSKSTGTPAPDTVANHLRDFPVNDSVDSGRGTISSSMPRYNLDSSTFRHYEKTNDMNEYLNTSLAQEMQKAELSVVWKKTFMGISTHIYGGSKILTPKHIDMLESSLPATHQCYDWKLVYRYRNFGIFFNFFCCFVIPFRYV
jgi:hypothetical protein